ncbi:MAG: biopolymer transporter ExbD [Nitrospirae bacterium]|nr:biopolymer transporter ExbD [Nitrospirota bacterium]
MVTAPLLQQGIDVNLPQARGKELPPAERIIITIKKDGLIYIDKAAVTVEMLKARLANTPQREVFLKADKTIPYGLVAEIMGEIKEAGIEKLGMITEQKPYDEK